jgi:hypothetical protein
MDPMSALAIVAAVVQFVDFGGRLLVKAWNKFTDLDDDGNNGRLGATTVGTRSQQAQLNEAKTAATELMTQLSLVKGILDEASDSLPACPGDLVRIHRKCNSLATDFRSVLVCIRDGKNISSGVRVDDNEDADSSTYVGRWGFQKMRRELEELRETVMQKVLLHLWYVLIPVIYSSS